MTLAFITPLRHPRNSADYGRVEELLADTLNSIARQSCEDYVAIVVGNKRPSWRLPERTHFVEVDFPPPSVHQGPCTGRAPSVWDKTTKLGIGLVAARAFDPEYVMPVDSDDFVHRDLAAFARDNSGRAGWVIKRGLIYSRRRNAFNVRRKLHRICGTSHIIPFDAFNVPTELTVNSTQNDVARAFSDYSERVLGGHRYALEWWRDRGRHLESLPFTGAVYHVDTGENHSGGRLTGPGIPYGSHLERDFGISPSRGKAATIWSSLGPAALKPDLRLRRPSFIRTAQASPENWSPPVTATQA